MTTNGNAHSNSREYNIGHSLHGKTYQCGLLAFRLCPTQTDAEAHHQRNCCEMKSQFPALHTTFGEAPEPASMQPVYGTST